MFYDRLDATRLAKARTKPHSQSLIQVANRKMPQAFARRVFASGFVFGILPKKIYLCESIEVKEVCLLVRLTSSVIP
jgi:hypothetical protein